MKKKMFLCSVFVCIAMLSNIIFAGIYNVIVLRSPDGKQIVRLYFDNHGLGNKEQSQEQFEIIRKSIEKFSTPNSFDILVESPHFYKPLEDEWVIVLDEGEQLKDVPAITVKDLDFGLGQEMTHSKEQEDRDKIWGYRSSIFSPIPYLIGKKIKPEDKNVHVISVDARDMLIALDSFIEGKSIVPEAFEGLSLKDVFERTLKQARSTQDVMLASFSSPPEDSVLETQDKQHELYKIFLETSKEIEKIEKEIKQLIRQQLSSDEGGKKDKAEKIIENHPIRTVTHIKKIKEALKRELALDINAIRAEEFRSPFEKLKKQLAEKNKKLQEYTMKMGGTQTGSSAMQEAVASDFEEISSESRAKKQMPESQFGVSPEKLKSQYVKFEEGLYSFINKFEKSVGEDAWNAPFEKGKKIDALFDSKTLDTIKKWFNNSTVLDDAPWLEYDLLRHIAGGQAAPDVAVFVGGFHAENMNDILQGLGYKIWFQKGYPKEDIFGIVFDPSLTYRVYKTYPVTAFDLVNEALQESLIPGSEIQRPQLIGPQLNENEQLIAAVSRGALDQVETLLKGRADINTVSPDGDTPLLIAFKNKWDIENIQWLLGEGANRSVNVADKDGRTPLSIAIRQKRIGWVDLLVSFGASLALVDQKVQEILLREAARYNQINVVKQLLLQGVNRNAVDNEGKTALDLAREKDNQDIVALLEGAGKEGEGVSGGQAPVEKLAAQEEVASGVQATEPVSLKPEKQPMQKEEGPSVEQPSSEDREHALLSVAQEGNIEAIEGLLATGIHVDAADEYGNTALILAAGKGYADVVERLLQAGADIDATARWKKSALMRAAINGHAEVVKKLLQFGADIDATDDNGKTALTLAKNQEIRNLLLLEAEKRNPGWFGWVPELPSFWWGGASTEESKPGPAPAK